MRASLGATLICLLAASCSLAGPSPSGTVLFQDDFSRRSSGWTEQDQPGFRMGYRDGAYQIGIVGIQTLAWSTPRFDVSDVRLEVDTTTEGPVNNAFGLICRFQDPGNYYFLMISSDGFAGIGQVLDGQRSMLSGIAMLPSDAILQGSGPNHLRADCIGPRLSLFVNGMLAQEALVAGWPSGDVGVIAGSYDEAGVEVRFDNFGIIQP